MFFFCVLEESVGFKIDHEFRGWHLLVKILLQFLWSLFYNILGRCFTTFLPLVFIIPVLCVRACDAVFFFSFGPVS